jgi:hypothetical protein
LMPRLLRLGVLRVGDEVGITVLGIHAEDRQAGASNRASPQERRPHHPRGGGGAPGRRRAVARRRRTLLPRLRLTSPVSARCRPRRERHAARRGAGVVDVYARVCSCRQCWASKCRGL